MLPGYSWCIFLSVLLSSLWSSAQPQCQDAARVDIFYRCQVNFLFPNTTSGDSVVYVVQEDGHAGRPAWLQLAPAGDSLIIYGTPRSEHIQDLSLEITGQNSAFVTRTQRLTLSIQSLQGTIFQTAKIFITNLDLPELLAEGNYSAVTSALRTVYGEPSILTVTDPRGNNTVPLPPAKRGVLVEVTPGLNVTTPPSVTTLEQVNVLQGNCSTTSNLSFPPSNFNQFSLESFTVDWCQYRLLDRESLAGEVTSSPPTSVMEVSPRVIPLGRRSSVTLVVIVVVVLVLALMGTSAIVCVCFSRRRHSFTVPKSKQVKSDAILKDAQLSTKELSKAQVVLRGMPSLAQEQGRTLEEREVRPPSTETGVLEYQDFHEYNGGMRLDWSLPDYHYDEELLPSPLTHTAE